MQRKKIALLVSLLMILIGMVDGCALLTKPPTWPEYQKEINFPARPEKQEYAGPDLSFLDTDKLVFSTPIYLDKNLSVTNSEEASYIAYTVEGHDVFVELAKRKKFAEDMVRLLDASNKLKHNIIQDLKQENWLTEKQLAIESWMRKVEQMNHDKEVTWYRIKDVVIGVGSIAIFVMGVLP